MAKAVSKLAILISANTTRVMDGFSKVGKRAKQLKKSLLVTLQGKKLKVGKKGA